MDKIIEKQRFHSLETFRFFAFLKVYFLHVPIQGTFPIFEFLKAGGGIGVAFFFVLSGFLITYLLAFEKKRTNKINVKQFLIRRSLRIWPLFFLMVIIAFLLPYDFKSIIGFHMIGGGYDLDWRYSFTFLENYRMLWEDNWPKTTPLSVFWSLCIEEHFYLFWVIIFAFTPYKHILKFLTFSVVLSWIARYIEQLISDNQTIISNDLFTNIDYFAVGGILAYYVVNDYEKLVSKIKSFNHLVKWSYVIFVILVVVFQKYVLPYDSNGIFYIFRSTIIAILFTLLIAIIIPNDSKIKFENKITAYLGKISYGLYVYHIIFIHVTFQLLIYLNIELDSGISIFLFILFTLGGSIGISALSFQYFEKRFLKYRETTSNKT